MKVLKRDGRIEYDDCSKIVQAIQKSTNGAKNYDNYKLTCLALKCLDEIKEKYGYDSTIEVDTIHDEVISFLKKNQLYELAINYAEYRDERSKCRMKNTQLMKAVAAISQETDRDNANK